MTTKIWECKIGECLNVPPGADMPMRVAIRKAYLEIVGREPNFLFSGWGGLLTEGERKVANENPSEVYIAGQLVWPYTLRKKHE